MNKFCSSSCFATNSTFFRSLLKKHKDEFYNWKVNYLMSRRNETMSSRTLLVKKPMWRNWSNRWKQCNRLWLDLADELINMRSVNSRLERENRDLLLEEASLKETTSKLETKCEELSASIDRLTNSERLANDQYSAVQLEMQALVRERDAILEERQSLEMRLEHVSTFCVFCGNLKYRCNFMHLDWGRIRAVTEQERIDGGGDANSGRSRRV